MAFVELVPYCYLGSYLGVFEKKGKQKGDAFGEFVDFAFGIYGAVFCAGVLESAIAFRFGAPNRL